MEQHRPGPLGHPAFLETKQLPVIRFGGALFRIHRTEHPPTFWGRTGLNRFDAPSQEFGVMYASTEISGAFIETFGDIEPHVISVNSLAANSVAQVVPTRGLALVELTGAGLARIGADARLFAADHSVAQAWSLALWSHPEAVDGIYYPARHDPSIPSVALYDRTSDGIGITPLGSLADSANDKTLGAILERYAFALIS